MGPCLGWRLSFGSVSLHSQIPNLPPGSLEETSRRCDVPGGGGGGRCSPSSACVRSGSSAAGWKAPGGRRAAPRRSPEINPSKSRVKHGSCTGCTARGAPCRVQGVPDVLGGARQKELTPLPRDLFPPVVYPLITVTFPFQSPITEPSSFLRAFC